VRSRQVAEQYLLGEGCPPNRIGRVLECIEFHHAGGEGRSLESVIFSDADALDFLGVIGMLRDFSKNPRALRLAHDVSRARMEKLPALITLEPSRRLMKARLARMERLFADLQNETGGNF
jgi:hypothetical protein